MHARTEPSCLDTKFVAFEVSKVPMLAVCHTHIDPITKTTKQSDLFGVWNNSTGTNQKPIRSSFGL